MIIYKDNLPTFCNASKMQDIKFSEKSYWQEYATLWQNNDMEGIVSFIANNPFLKYKIFNSENWNRLIAMVNDGTSTVEPTKSSLVGIWNYDYNVLKQKSENFKYRGEWQANIQYEVNNLVKVDDFHSYFCIQSHLSSVDNKPPTSGFWIEAKVVLGPTKLVISSDKPINMVNGSVYLQKV